MCVVFMKNFLLADSSELFMMYALFMKIFHLACWDKLMTVRLISAFWAQKHLIPTFLEMMYVEFMKNFHLA